MVKSYMKLALASLFILVFFWGVLAALNGCATVSSSARHYSPASADSKTVATGNDQNIEWSCNQFETDQSTVLVNCKFHNFQSSNTLQQACVQVAFYTGVSKEVVAQSGPVCSGGLEGDVSTNRIVPFQRQPRAEMRAQCGVDSSYCKLVVRQVSVPAGN